MHIASLVLHITSPSVACVTVPCSAALSLERHVFRGGDIEHKMSVLILCTTIVCDISHFKKNSAKCCHNSTYIGLHAQYRFACEIRTNLNFLDRFSKHSQVQNFMKIHLMAV